MIPVLYGACVVASEIWISLGPRRSRRRRAWSKARERARATGKPLLVVGDPDGGAVHPRHGRDYGCGHGVIDPTGTPGCVQTGYPTRWAIDGSDRPLRGRAEDVLPRLPSNSAVIYLSCVLEYVDDLDLVWRELHRVSGGDLFTVNVEPWSLTAFFFKGKNYGPKRRIMEVRGNSIRARSL